MVDLDHSARLWRPAAQRNLRNQWSKLASLRHEWHAVSSNGRSHATSLVNSYLSQKYMNKMNFGALSKMPDIQTKACHKLLKQQELHRHKLLSSYKEMVSSVNRMVDVCKTMRCYFKWKTSTSPLTQFSFSSEEASDSGDYGGVPIFTFLSIASFEEHAWEIVRMFISELNLKRLVVMELLSIYDEKFAEISKLRWSDEFYEGEFEDFRKCSLYSDETQEPVFPKIRGLSSGNLTEQFKQEQDRKVLEVDLTTWMVEVNIDRCRIDEIFCIVGEEMRVELS